MRFFQFTALPRINCAVDCYVTVMSVLCGGYTHRVSDLESFDMSCILY